MSISFFSPDPKTTVLSYTIEDLNPHKLYTVAVYQFEAKKAVLRQLIINVSSDAQQNERMAGFELSPMNDLVGTKGGRKVYVDLYLQKHRIEIKGLKRFTKKQRSLFSLPEFRILHRLSILDSQNILYFIYNNPKHVSDDPNTLSSEEKKQYLKQWSNLTDAQEKYCRCVLHVAAKNTATCNKSKGWTNYRTGTVSKKQTSEPKCYNPYAVCAKTTRTSVRYCGLYYEWSKIPARELMAYAQLRKIDLPARISKDAIIKILMKEVDSAQKR